MDTGNKASAAPQPQVVSGPLTFPVSAIYANGFKAGLSAGDVFVVLERNGVEFAVLNMSYTIAKTLAYALDALIKQLETTGKQQIMTTEYISHLITQPPPPSNPPSKPS